MLEGDLKRLYLVSEQFMSFAELKVESHATMTMAQWGRKLDEMMRLNDLEVLDSKGSVSHEDMEKKVSVEMKKYRDAGRLKS